MQTATEPLQEDVPTPASGEALNGEAARLAALRGYSILDTEPEDAFDELAHLAAEICQTPLALISFVDSDRQWFKSRVGSFVHETPRSVAFCDHAIRQTGMLIIPDTLADPRFAGNPLVISEPRIRFYAGAPLITPEGLAVGAFCVVDVVPRNLSQEQVKALRTLSRQVAALLELRRLVADQNGATALPQAAEQTMSVRGLGSLLETGRAPLFEKRTENIARLAIGTKPPAALAITPPRELSGPALTAHLHDISEQKREEEVVLSLTKHADLRMDVGAALATSDDLRGILKRCAQAIVRHLDAAFARIWTLNQSENVLELQASAGIYTHIDGPHCRVPVGQLKIGLIAQERRPHLTNDVSNDPRVSNPEWARREGMIAFAGYPLLVEDRLVGVMAVFARRPFTEATLQAFASVTDAIAQCIERKRIEEALRRAHNELESHVEERTAELARANQALRAEVTERKRTEEALRESEKRFRQMAENIGEVVWMCDPEIKQIDYINPAYETIWGRSCQSLYDQPLSFLDAIHSDDRRRVVAAIEEQKLGVPFDVDFRLVHPDGSVRWVWDRSFMIRNKQGQLERLVGVVQDITGRKRAEERLAVQYAVGRILTESVSLDDAAPKILAAISECLRWEVGIFWSMDRSANLLRCRTTSHAPTVEASEFAAACCQRSISASAGLPGRVLASGESAWTSELLPDTNFCCARGAAKIGMRGAFAFPVRGGARRILGVIEFFTTEVRSPDDELLRAMDTLGNQVGQFIERTQAQEQIVRQVEHLTALREVDSAITGSLDLGTTLGVVLDQVTTHLKVDAADVLLCNPHTMTLEYAAGRGFRTRVIRDTLLKLDRSLAGQAALERRAIRIDDLSHPPETFVRSSLVAVERFVTYHAMPLVAKGQVKGVLEIFHRAALNPDPEWLDFLEALASQAAIALDNASLFEELERSNQGLILAYDETIEGWSRALDLRDRETEGHTQRVAEITMRLARLVGIGPAELVHVRRGALLHDIGKMGIPDQILLKPGPLTDQEWRIMRLHPLYAYDMLWPISFLRSAIDIPYCHHEKWDGTGYPRGIKGERIPLAARVFASADIWDALRYDRPYRVAWPRERIYEHIRSLAGTHLDPAVVKVFLENPPAEDE